MNCQEWAYLPLAAAALVEAVVVVAREGPIDAREVDAVVVMAAQAARGTANGKDGQCQRFLLTSQ